MFSIRFRIVAASTLVFSIIILIAFYITLIDINENEHKIVDNQLFLNSIFLTAELENNNVNFHALRKLADILKNEYGDIRIGIFDSTRTNILSGSKLFNKTTELIAWDNKFSGKDSFSDIVINNEEFRGFTNHLIMKQQYPVAVVLAISDNKVTHKHHIHAFFFFTIVPAFILILSFVAYRLTKTAFKPVMKMIETVKSITASRLDKRLELPDSKDEIRTLGETLNDMISRINDSFNSQKRFIADASHEMRTPLTVIQTELELAAQNTAEVETKESIRISLAEIGRLNSLTSSLLELARIDGSGNFLTISKCRIDELLIDSVSLMQKQAKEKGIELQLSISEALEADIDSDKIKSTLINFIDNSIKYSDEGKKIEISLSVFNDYYEIKISDHGFGISAEELPNIFKRFYRSNEIRAKISGSGIGLALADEIVKMHKGTISVSSKVNEGTTAVIKLPRSTNKTI